VRSRTEEVYSYISQGSTQSSRQVFTSNESVAWKRVHARIAASEHVLFSS
jgi:hypothetical protein